MQATLKRMIGRWKLLRGTCAASTDFWLWGGTPIQLPDILPENLTPYAVDYNKKEVLFVETPEDYSLLGKPFMYHEQFKRAERVMTVTYDDWFKWVKSQPIPDKPIFVCGIGRSGTTLINRALHRLPDTTVYDEPDVFMQMLRLPPEERRTLLGATTKSLNQTGTRLVIKQRAFVSYAMDDILKTFPDARVLFLYRSTYDWIVSNMRLILRTPAPAGIVHEVVRMSFKRYLPALDPREFAPLQMVEAGALLWLKFFERYTQLREAGYPILGVRYEDMIDHPETVLTQIFDFCDLPQTQVPEALKAFERNSQANTIYSRKNLADVELNERQKRLIKGMLDQHEWLNDPYIRLPGSVEPRVRELA